jgi:importin subunit beta-1
MDITTVLSNTQNPDASIRTAAEQQLKAVEAENPAAFFVSLAQELGSNDKDPNIRQAAGLVLKNALDANDQHRKMERAQRWLALDDGTKGTVRNVLTQTFASPDHISRHTAAQVTAKVAAIDVPQGQWPELIDGLVSTVTTGDNPFAKEASLECLGYICEDMDDGVLRAKSNDILTAVVAGMNDPILQIKSSATRAMENSIEFTSENFESEAERNVIMGAILQNSQYEDIDVREHAFMCLVKVAENYYDHLPQYMEEIFRQTAEVLQQSGVEGGPDEEEKIGLQALEFWTTVCEEEAERIYEQQEGNTENPPLNYMVQVCPHLVPMLEQSLCKQDDEQTTDMWNLSQAAAVCLTFCAQAIRDDVVGIVMPFVTGSIQSPDWRLREAATMAFGCILEGPSKESLAALVGEAIPIMLQKLEDQSVLVRDTSAWALGRIAEHHGTLLGGPMLEQYIVMLMQSLKDEPRVAYQACYALHELGTAWCEEEGCEESYPISPAFESMIQNLLEATKRPDASESNLRTAAYEAVATIIEHSANDCTEATGMLLPFIMTELQGSFQSGLDANEQMELQGTLCGIMNNIIQKLGEGVRPHADNVMLLLLQVFNAKVASVQEEAIMCVGALADGVQGDFQKYMESFMPHLQTGLQNWQETDVCRAAVGAVGDACRALEANVAVYCDVIVAKLLEALQAPTLDRAVKPEILSVLGDIALATEENFASYLPFTMAMLMQAAQSPMPDSDDYDLIENVHKLRESVLEAMTGIIQGLKKNLEILGQGLQQYAPQIMEFLKVIATEEDTPPEVLKAAVGVLGDLCDGLPGLIKQYVGMPFIEQLLTTANQCEDEQIQELASWTYTKVSICI